MKKTLALKPLIFIFILSANSLYSNIIAQGRMPEVMDNGTLEEQLQYINDRTRIYENYRAIREDIFQKMKSNSLDSLNTSKEKILLLADTNSEQENTISGLNRQISDISDERDAAIKNRDSLLFFGMNLTKSAYNKILWSLIIALLLITAFVFLLFKRSNSVTRTALKDLEDIKKEFEEFRRIAHENKEKLIVSHFNEIKKMKEMGR